MSCEIDRRADNNGNNYWKVRDNNGVFIIIFFIRQYNVN